MKEVFVVVGKKPERGVSKTRLSQSVGEEKALKIYEAFLKDFFTRLKIHTSFPILFFGSSNDGSGQSYFKELFNKLECHDIKYFDQPIGGLMERLTNIFKRVEKDYPGVFVHLTGTDIPDFPFKYLHEIDYEKVNLGPDDDGGYYYVGTKAKNHFLFELPAHLEGSESLLDKTKILIRNKNMGLQ
ncbi:MAG: DUF2064 domain-containing protein, partial [Bdellovibrionales bacterium]|nr:DUF2064 domain-containing protein [Bdellovibrionales bacterium]